MDFKQSTKPSREGDKVVASIMNAQYRFGYYRFNCRRSRARVTGSVSSEIGRGHRTNRVGWSLAWCVCATLAISMGTVVGQETAAPDAEETAAESTTATPASSPEALSAYSQAANYQNNRAFDLAAESWQKFLEAYADDPKAVDAHYNLGVCYLELKEFAKARQSLQAALARKQDFTRREDAFLNLGWSLYTMAVQSQPDLLPEAERAFAQLLAEYPQGKYRDQAWFLSGESLYMQGKRAEAAEAYVHLVNEHGDSKLLPNGLYALGVTYEELGRFEDAAAQYTRFLKDFADDELSAEVQMRRAETVLQRGDVAAAEKLFAEASAIEGFTQADHARFRQAFCVARQDRFAEAAALFASIVSEFPESQYQNEAVMAAARAYFRAEDDEQAAKWFDRLLDGKGPVASEAAHWRARLLLKEGKAEAALALVDRYLPNAVAQKHPFAPNLSMDRADAMYELPDRKQQAMELYLALWREVPEHMLAPQALYNAAFAALELKDYRTALGLSQDFLAKYSEHRLTPDVKRIVAECQLQLGDSAAAEKTFAQLASDSEKTDDAGRLQLRQAVALYMQKKYDETLTRLTSHIDSFATPEQRAEALYLMGISYFGQQQFDKARDALSESLATQASWRQADEALLFLSRAQHHLEQTAEARQTAERLLRDFPESGVLDQATYRLADYCYALEDYPAAAEHYRTVVERWPDSGAVPYSLYGWGWSQLRESQFGDGQTTFSRLLSQFPDHKLAASALYARALARQQSGDFAAALEDVELYLAGERTELEQSDAMYVRALCLVGLKQYEPAITTLQQIAAATDNPAGDKVLYELAWAYAATERPPESTATFEQLATRYPQSPFAAEALYHVGESRYDAQDYPAAIQAYQDARKANSAKSDLTEKICYKLGWALYQHEQFSEAQAAFADQLQAAPEGELSGDALFMLGECLFKQGKYQDALQQFTQARDRDLSSEQITTLAYLHAGQSAAQLQQWQVSHDWLAAVARKYPESPHLLPIGYELAVAQQNLGNVAEAERLFGSIADRARGEMAARARFMLGEVLYAKQEHVAAIREFRKVMFGYDPAVEPDVAPWQAKAGFEAGQCAGILASQQTTRSARQQYLELATRFFQFVQTRHPDTAEANAATEQLKKYGVVPE